MKFIRPALNRTIINFHTNRRQAKFAYNNLKK